MSPSRLFGKWFDDSPGLTAKNAELSSKVLSLQTELAELKARHKELEETHKAVRKTAASMIADLKQEVSSSSLVIIEQAELIKKLQAENKRLRSVSISEVMMNESHVIKHDTEIGVFEEGK
jgi:alkyl hydroperoxide reductase subunit AhpC